MSDVKELPLVGYEGIYTARSNGTIYTNKTGHEKIVSVSIIGEKKRSLVGLYKNKKLKTYSVPRLIAETFIENPHNLPQVNHKNFDTTDNSVDNLEWCTAEENTAYRKKFKTKNKYKGVYWTPLLKKYLVLVHKNKIKHTVGYYKCEKLAALAYNAKAKCLHGNFAYLNEVV